MMLQQLQKSAVESQKMLTEFISVILEGSDKEILINPHYIANVMLDDRGVVTLYDSRENGMCVKGTLVDMKLKLGMCRHV